MCSSASACAHEWACDFVLWLCCSVAKEVEHGINTVMVGDCIPSRTTHVRKATVGWDQSVHQISSGGPGIYNKIMKHVGGGEPLTFLAHSVYLVQQLILPVQASHSLLVSNQNQKVNWQRLNLERCICLLYQSMIQWILYDEGLRTKTLSERDRHLLMVLVEKWN